MEKKSSEDEWGGLLEFRIEMDWSLIWRRIIICKQTFLSKIWLILINTMEKYLKIFVYNIEW